MNDVYTYSIIIPHKNTPNLLNRCVDSIPERDDVQIIIVDDNSDNDKKPIIKRKGVEIILLNAEQSKGAGRARNVGLEYAKGKWLLFADADDYYTNYLPILLDKYAENETTDIVYLNSCMFDENGKTKPFYTEKLIKDYVEGLDGAENELRYNLWTPWSRMVKKYIIENNRLRYDELPATNDKMFCLQCSYYARNIEVEFQTVYKYFRPTGGSLTDKQRDFGMLDGLLDVRRRTILLYKSAGYKRLPSYWSILYKTSYVKNLSCSVVLKKYVKVLHDSHTNIVVDLVRFFKNKLYYLNNL